MRRLLISFAAGLLAVFWGCSKSDTPAPADSETNAAAPSPVASPAGPALDACSLLTSEEIEAVQGEPVKKTKPSANSKGKLSVSQCYFELPTFINSISLQVVQRGSGAEASDPKQAWNEMFHKEQPPPVGEGARRKEPPERIEGIGDEAFWAGNDKIGVLHVLKGNSYISLSIGGGDDKPARIKKSRDLADIALKRL
jgi:hypothetical protein